MDTPTADEPLLTQSTQDGVRTLVLNRPHAMNALSFGLQRKLADAINVASDDDAVRVIILTGAGDRAFSAGLDLREIGRAGLGSDERAQGTDPLDAMNQCGKPIIGAINGVAITGGFELALACDILLASTHCRFADTHVRMGVIPGWGLSQRLSRVIGISRAKELSLTGNFIDAHQALAWGLVNRVVEPHQLMANALELAAQIASCDPDMVMRYKTLIDDGYRLSLAEGQRLETERSKAQNASLTPAALAERREAVQQRGRSQVA